jgi:uncharacterized membrane-anchored protein YjiN (DUF445 family)
MPRTLLLIVCGLALALTGCKEKTELRELCAMKKVGERTFESESLARAVESLRRAEESEEISTTLEKKRNETDERRKAQLAANLEERTAAEAIPKDDRDARRKAILEVTAKEQETQKLSDEIAKYFIDIERNEKAAAAARKAAAQLLAPVQKQYGVKACPVLAGPAKSAGTP